MTSPTSRLRARLKLCVALGTAAIIVISAPRIVDAQGLVQGVQQGAREGNKAAGPVGGVLGGAIGGVVGVVTGVTGVITGKNGQPAPAQTAAPAQTPAPNDKDRQGNAAKSAKAPAKGTKEGTKAANLANPAKQPVVLTQQGAPQLSPEQIVANSDADRLNLRVARAKRDPPDDVIEQMRNEAQFLVDRAADQRNVADAAEPLFVILDDKQKQIFIDEMVRLSHERGLD